MPDDLVRSMIRAKDMLKKEIDSIKVGLLLQVDRGPYCRKGQKRHVTRFFQARDFRPTLLPETVHPNLVGTTT